MPQSNSDLICTMAERIMNLDHEVAERARVMQPQAIPDGLEGGVELEGMPDGDRPPPDALETIVVREGRPVLLVSNDDYVVEGPEAAIWRKRLEVGSVRAKLHGIIPAVGRIEVENHPTLSWVGTGWLIDDDVIVTNRHVAQEFVTVSANGFVFRRGWSMAPTRMAARVDFREERGTVQPNEFRVLDILHIEDDDGPDIAFLKVANRSEAGLPLAGKIRLSSQGPEAEQFVATIGYPAADSRVPDQDLVRHIFGDVYNVKRLAPGQLLKPRDDLILHDCSTLGGNSGSPIIDLNTGTAVGLHFSGLFLQENRGVSAAAVRDRLEKVRRSTLHPVPRTETQPSVAATQSVSVGGEQTIRIDVTIPIDVSVKVGTVRVAPAAPSRTVESTVAQARALFDIDALRTDGFSWSAALGMASASQLAYHLAPDITRVVVRDWGCEECHDFSTQDTDGFIASHPEAVFVCFRGTSSLGDWLRNIDFVGINRRYGRVHRGFAMAYDVVAAEVRKKLDDLDTGSKKIWLTGHSLGGALATIAAADLADDYDINGIYTYGMPRSGTKTFQTFFADRYGSKLFRFVNNQDIVPRVPPGYRHVGQLYFFDAQGRFVADATESAAPTGQLEPEPLTKQEFEILQAELGTQAESVPSTSGLGADANAPQGAASESLEGAFPSVSDHDISLYIALIQRQLQRV